VDAGQSSGCCCPHHRLLGVIHAEPAPGTSAPAAAASCNSSTSVIVREKSPKPDFARPSSRCPDAQFVRHIYPSAVLDIRIVAAASDPSGIRHYAHAYPPKIVRRSERPISRTYGALLLCPIMCSRSLAYVPISDSVEHVSGCDYKRGPVRSEQSSSPVRCGSFGERRCCCRVALPGSFRWLSRELVLAVRGRCGRFPGSRGRRHRRCQRVR
jgi:hypothetical protein